MDRAGGLIQALAAPVVELIRQINLHNGGSVLKVELLNAQELDVVALAFRECTNTQGDSYYEISPPYGDVDFFLGEKDKRMIKRNGLELGHGSALEHMNFSFRIEGVSRALLQEFARHRHASLSVKSTRYTLKELLDEFTYTKEEASMENKKKLCEKYCVIPAEFSDMYKVQIGNCLWGIAKDLKKGMKNDVAKYMLPECFKTSLMCTINLRSLRNMIELRSAPAALWEFRALIDEMIKATPKKHRWLFEDVYKGDISGLEA